MLDVKGIFRRGYGLFNKIMDFLLPFGDLLIRLVIARVFLMSGWVKFQNIQTTILLFRHEYQVPFLPPHIAAYLATGVELIFPVLLALGLGGRLPAFILFVFNAVAAFSYPFLWTPAGAVGLMQHCYWGLLLIVLMTHGSGRYSVDRFLEK